MKAGHRKRALVAGGAGFLGSHLCDRLVADGMDVVCLDNFLTGRRDNLAKLEHVPGFDVVETDVVDPLPAAVRRQKFDQIFNLACAASPSLYQANPEHTLLTSVIGTRQLLQLAERLGARFLLTSTSEIYGDPEVHPQREDYRGSVDPIGPRACYDEGKRAAETLAFDYGRMRRCQVRITRIFNTYGPRLSASDGRIVSNVIVQALAGKAITVNGDGEQTRSFCYVSDLIEGLIRLMAFSGPQSGPINLGNPSELTINALVRKILDITGSTSPIRNCPLPVDDPRRRRPDIGKARQLLDWSPAIDLAEGLTRTVRWFQGLLKTTSAQPIAAVAATA